MEAVEAVSHPIDFSEIQKMARAKIEEERAAFDQPAPATSPFDDEELLAAVRSGEVGDSRIFIALNRGRRVFDHAAGRWYEFVGHSWQPDRVDNTLSALDGVVDLYAKLAYQISLQVVAATKAGNKELAKTIQETEQLVRKKIGLLQKRYHRENVLVLAAAGNESLGITGQEWDSHPYLLTFANGTLDLQTMAFGPGRADDYIKTPSPTEWKGFGTPAPCWEKFLSEILDGDDEVISYLRRLLGYSIAGLTVEHILPILWGAHGRNGKGCTLETLGNVLGPLGGPIPGELMLEQKNPRSSAAPSPDIMSLRGRRLAWASETDEGRVLNSGRVKLLCGGDTLTGRPPFGKHQVTFRPTHTLFLLTNFRPRVNPEDAALWERIHLIEFKISFVDHPVGPNQKPRDKDLPTKLLKESSGIAAWLVAGFIEWRNQGLKPPLKIINSTCKYRQSEDLIQQFIDECCDVRPEAFCQGGEILEAYQKWCGEKGVKARRRKFYEKLAADFDSSRLKSGKVYYGVAVMEVSE